MRRGLARVMAGLLMLLAVQLPSWAEALRDPAVLKVAILRNFMEFVQWPEMPAELVLCSVGQDGLGHALNDLQAYRIQKSTLTVRRNVPLTSLGVCHVLFVPGTERLQLGTILALVRNQPVLVIADFAGGAQLGATLSLHETGERLGFDANHGAAEKAGLRLSSRLLQLAQRVY